MDIKPNVAVSVEVTARPTNEAVRKTLMRLFRKDPVIAKHMRIQDKHRPSWQLKRRGGRMWHHQMKSKPPINLEAGSSYSLVATVDVLRDLNSVQRFVKVTAK